MTLNLSWTEQALRIFQANRNFVRPQGITMYTNKQWIKLLHYTYVPKSVNIFYKACYYKFTNYTCYINLI